MVTEYYRVVRDCGDWDSHVTTIRVTRNLIGHKTAEFVSRHPADSFWNCLLRCIEVDRMLPPPFAMRKM